jgi:hypothetical protein
MAATPESKVKDRVKKILLKYPKSYYLMPMTGGYGSSGAPDIVACIDGKFIGVECKAKGNKPTALQMKNLTSIVESGGHALIVDDMSIGVFILVMDNIVFKQAKPALVDLTREDYPPH